MSNYQMQESRKAQERPLRLAQGDALLRELNAKTGDERKAARADLMRANEVLRAHGFQA